MFDAQQSTNTVCRRRSSVVCSQKIVSPSIRAKDEYWWTAFGRSWPTCLTLHFGHLPFWWRNGGQQWEWAAIEKVLGNVRTQQHMGDDLQSRAPMHLSCYTCLKHEDGRCCQRPAMRVRPPCMTRVVGRQHGDVNLRGGGGVRLAERYHCTKKPLSVTRMRRS
jgi:hypothetical protein